MTSGEQYCGIKFSCTFLSRDLPQSEHFDKFLYWNHLFAERGLAPEHSTGSYGNMSFRLAPGSNQFIITRTGASLQNLTINDCVCIEYCNIDTFTMGVHGMAEPSSESFIHAELYAVRPNVNAIFHGHSDAILSLAHIPTTEKEYPYGTLELMHAALSLKDTPLFNLKNHGFFSTADTMDKAGEQVLKLLR